MCSALLILALTPTALANPAEANEQVPDAAELPTPPVEGSEQPERTTEEPSTPDTALEDEPGDVTTAPPTPPPGPVHVQTPGWPDADVETARRALDERLEPDERLQALEALREGYGPDATWLLRSTARERDLSLQLPIIDMLASSEDHEDQDVLRWVITDLESDWDARSAAMDRLVAQSNRGAGRLLWTLSSQPAVPGILRARASAALREKYPEILAELGEPRAVSDALGGLAFTVGWGVAGGTALSSLGTWGRFDGGPAIGGVGGSLTGMGLAGYSLTRAPRTTGQGTALLSGTSWGLTTSLWASDAIYGRGGAASRSWDAYDNGSAAIRMAGVAGGTALGMYWQSTKPTGWDVMEVNMATYLGSAMALSGTALALWRPEYAWWSRWEPNSRARIRAERIMDASNIAGAAAGLRAGLALHRTWDLDERA